MTRSPRRTQAHHLRTLFQTKFLRQISRQCLDRIRKSSADHSKRRRAPGRVLPLFTPVKLFGVDGDRIQQLTVRIISRQDFNDSYGPNLTLQNGNVCCESNQDRDNVRHRQRNRRSLGFTVQRKVRAPQDTMVGNAHRPRGSGKCNRKQTANRRIVRDPLEVRVKRCGKSAPAIRATESAG